jgi:hypothetical protein
MTAEVGTSMSGWAVCGQYHSAERTSFFASGRRWVFYHDGSNFGFRSSDGISWTPFMAIGDASCWNIHFDGRYIHYVRSISASSEPIYYRRGEPNADGTITWSDFEQIPWRAEGYHARYVDVKADSFGYPYIVLTAHWGSDAYQSYVTKSARNDGVWITASGYPMALGLTYTKNILLALTEGKMYVLYTLERAIAGRFILDNILGGVETIGTMAGRSLLSALPIGDDVYLVYTDNLLNIIFKKRTFHVGWSDPDIIQTVVRDTTKPALSVYGASDLICFFAFDNHIYYKKCVDGIWDAHATDYIDESAEGLTDNREITCWPLSYNGGVGLVNLAAHVSPFNVKFYLLPLAPKIATSISINVNPTSGVAPFQVIITGNLVDSAGNGLSDKSINLYVNGTLTGTQITGPEGDCVWYLDITTTGTYQCQTEFLGDATYEGCTVHDGTCTMVSEGFPWWIFLIIGGGALGAYALSKKKKR